MRLILSGSGLRFRISLIRHKTVRSAFSILLILFLLPELASAQYTSRLGRFEVDVIKGCAPLTVNVTNLEPGKCTPGDPCDMDYEGNNQFLQQQFTHSYNQPGTYTLRILYQTIGMDDIVIEVDENIQPDFELYACSGNEVQLRLTDTNYDEYVIDFNDGSPPAVVLSGSITTHAYAASGNQSVTVRGRNLDAADNCNATTQPFIARATIPAPEISQVEVISSSQVDLTFTNFDNIQYRLEIAQNGSAAFQLVKTVYNTTTISVTNLNTEANYYCFRLGAVDPCNGTVAYSNINCSLRFDLSIQSDVNQLSWTTGPGAPVNFYRINRDGNSIGAAALMQYSDSDIDCGIQYCYQVATFYANGTRSTSRTKCGTAFSTTPPPPITNITAAVGTSGVELTWFPDVVIPGVSYDVVSGPPGNVSTGLITTPQTTFIDEAYTTGTNACYRIHYVDECNNQAPYGIEACPVFLSASLNPDNTINLSWTAYSGWSNGVNRYVIEKYDAENQLLATINNGSNTTYADLDVDLSNQVFTYIIHAIPNEAGLGEATSNAVQVIKEPKLFYPSAFTPDKRGPAENELFKVYGQFVEKFELRIFNRWGQLLYVATSFDQGWDGTYGGIPQPEATYIFKAELTDRAGRKRMQEGSLLLLRKSN